MRTRASATMAAFILSASASSAQAGDTVSVATLRGGFNGDPVYRSFIAKIEFDPSLGVISPFEDGYQLLWDESMGGPSPLLGAYVHLPKFEGGDFSTVSPADLFRRWSAPTQFGSTSFTSFALRVSTYHYAFDIDGPDLSMEIGAGIFLSHVETHSFPHHVPVFGPGGLPAVDDGFCCVGNLLGDYGHWSLGPAFSPLATSIRVDRVAVPEPATWLILVAGFGLVGAGLRRREGLTLQA